MTTESKNGYVKWTVFTFVMSILIAIAAWFANMTNEKLDFLVSKVYDIDKRTAILETLNEKENVSIKDNLLGLLRAKR